jgi:hypothetical protein
MKMQMWLDRKERVHIIDNESDHLVLVSKDDNGRMIINLLPPPHEPGPPLLTVEIDGSKIRAIRGDAFVDILRAIQTGADDIDRGVDTK